MAAVLATAEFCAEPMEGGIGEPQFCRLTAPQEIATPYFSIVVAPEFLVGVHQQGRRLLLQSSIHQNQDYLTIEVLDGSSVPDWSGCAEVAETVETNVTWQDCRIASNGSHERRLAARLAGMQVLIQYGYTTSATILAPALERMTQSIRIVAREGGG